MAEMSNQQARALLEQLRDRNAAINQIDAVLTRHAMATAELDGMEQALASKQADLRSVEQNISAKLAQTEEAQVLLNDANANFGKVRKEALDAISGEIEQARLAHEKTLEGFAIQIEDAERRLARVNTALVQQQKALEQIHDRIEALKAVSVE
jgi:chromosome segregation ATPase